MGLAGRVIATGRRGDKVDVMRFSELIDAFAPAQGPPPARLGVFMRWALGGTFGVIAVTASLSVLVGLMEVFAFWLVGWVIDFVLAAGPEAIFADNWGLFLAIGLFFVALRPVVLWLNACLQGLGVMNNIFPLILSRLHRHTIGQGVSFFDDDFAGRIAQKQQQTARAITDVVGEILQAGGFAASALLGAAVLLGTIHPALAAVLVLWFLLIVAVVRWFLPRVRLRAKDRAAARAMMTGQIVDTITNIQTVKLFAHDAHEDRAALDALGEVRARGIAFSTLTVWFRVSIVTCAGMLPAAMIGGAVWLWSDGVASAGDIATAAMIATRFAQMSNWLSFTALGVFSNIGEIEDGMRTLARDHQLVDRAEARRIARARGAVMFEDVSFGYGREGAALDGFALALTPGQKVGLVGRSGAGKTTAVSLLLRLYDVERGRITVDGIDIRDIAQNSLRQQIGMVTQDAAMFNRSAMENIRYGRPEASDAEVFDAARKAEAHAFIPDLVDFRGRAGYAAHLGERGVKLSGGQRQRIALARAILKDPPILVLDEATSALDSEVEAAIQKTLKTLMQGKTVIAIAHRLSTIAEMDRIIVMDEGRIVEDGNHSALIAAGGVYAEFWARQSGGFLGVAAE